MTGEVEIDMVKHVVVAVDVGDFKIVRVGEGFEVQTPLPDGSIVNEWGRDLDFLLKHRYFGNFPMPAALRQGFVKVMNITPVNWDYVRKYFPNSRFDWVLNFGKPVPGCSSPPAELLFY